MRNRLNAAVLAVEMLRLQLAAGDTVAAEEPLDKVVNELRALAMMLQSESTTTPAPPRQEFAGRGKPSWSKTTRTRATFWPAIFA